MPSKGSSVLKGKLIPIYIILVEMDKLTTI